MELARKDASPVEDLELAPASLAGDREPEVGVELLTSQPWVNDPASPTAQLENGLPAWLCELEVPMLPAAPPPPRRTAPAPPALLNRLRQQAAIDPFAALLAQDASSDDELDAGAEPTIQQLSPLFAEEQQWWIAPPAPSPVRPTRTPTVEQPVCTPPQWRAARRSEARPIPPRPSMSELSEPPAMPPPMPRPARNGRVVSVVVGALVCAAIGVTLLGGRQSAAATDLVVPPPPAFQSAVPSKIEPERSAAAPQRIAAATRERAGRDRDHGQKLVKRTRAAKKWAAESWPQPAAAVEAAPQPEAELDPLAPVGPPPSSDELKRPEF